MWKDITIVMLILSFVYFLYLKIRQTVLNYRKIQVEELNKVNREAHERELAELETRKRKVQEELNGLTMTLTEHTRLLEENINSQDSILQKQLEENKSRIQDAFCSYVESLENHLSSKEDHFDQTMQEYQNELNKIKATRAALMEAALREKEIQEASDFYRIVLDPTDIAEIAVLEEIKPRIRRQEVLSKLIWTTYYQKGASTLCSNVVGKQVRCGIYKLTDLTTGLAYIGQSVDISKRFTTHMKNALGAVSGPIPSNKLYAQMRKVGVENFTFEIIEDCPRAQLNEKEKYYIDLYQTSTFGLNTVKGVSR